MFTADSFDDALFTLIEDIDENGSDRNARGMVTTDLTSVGFELTNPRDRLCTFKARDIRIPYCAASVAWNLLMRNDVESISLFNDNGRRISDDGETFKGADYGKRMLYKVHGKRSPLYEAINLLEHDRDTRRAWVPILNWYFDGGDYSKEGKDVPCTIGFQLSMREDDAGYTALDMAVVMRSQAVLGVMPYDVFLFTVLQELLANQLGCKLGKYEHFCLSAHIYEREAEWVDKIFSEKHMLLEPRLDKEMDPINLNVDEAIERWGAAFKHIVHWNQLYLQPDESGEDEIISMMNQIVPQPSS